LKLKKIHLKFLSIKCLRKLYLRNIQGYTGKKKHTNITNKTKNIAINDIITALLESGMNISFLTIEMKNTLNEEKLGIYKAKQRQEKQSEFDKALCVEDFTDISHTFVKDLYVLAGLGQYIPGEFQAVRNFEGNKDMKKGPLVKHLIWYLNREEFRAYVESLWHDFKEFRHVEISCPIEIDDSVKSLMLRRIPTPNFLKENNCRLLSGDLMHLSEDILGRLQDEMKAKGYSMQNDNDEGEKSSSLMDLINNLIDIKITQQDLGDKLIKQINVAKLFLQVQWYKKYQLPEDSTHLNQLHGIFFDLKIVKELFEKKGLGKLTKLSKKKTQFLMVVGKRVIPTNDYDDVVSLIITGGITKDDLDKETCGRIRKAQNKIKQVQCNISNVTQLVASDINVLPPCLIRDIYVLKGLGMSSDTYHKKVKTFLGFYLNDITVAVNHLIWSGLSIHELQSYLEDAMERIAI